MDLEENVDFDYDDIDEVKNQNFPKKYLKNIYKYGGNIYDNKMEFWNMHTYSNKVIEKEKISILKYGEDLKVNNILKHLIEDNFDYVKENCELLFEYYNYVY